MSESIAKRKVFLQKSQFERQQVHTNSVTSEQVKIQASNVPEEKTDMIVKLVNEAMDKFSIEKVCN